MKLNKREKEVLCDILKTEIIEVEDMVKDDEDKEELESYLETVKSIFLNAKVIMYVWINNAKGLFR